jgi:hypothetical protein
VAAVETAVLMFVFLMIIFAIIEMARAMFIYQTVHEATRFAARAAATTSHRDTAALDRIRQRAVLRDSPGELILGRPVTDRNVRIDYLALLRKADGSMSLAPISPSSLPLCPRQNREICMRDPYASNCIRFVRARICEDDGAAGCNPVRYQSLVQLIAWEAPIPIAQTVRPAESFGSLPEGTPCL